MKAIDIINRVRNIAGDVNVLQFTNDQVLDWINDGIRECAVANNLLQKRATQNLVVGQSDYPLPSDVYKLHSLKVDGAKIPIRTLEEYEKMSIDASTRGAPVGAYVWAGNISLFPAPSAVKPLVIDYTYDPSPLLIANISDPVTGLPPIPSMYHARLVDYCLAQVAQQDDDMNRYQLKMQEFTTGVQAIKDVPEYEHDVYPSISASVRDMGYDWEDGQY